MKVKVLYALSDDPGVAEFGSKREAEEFEAFVRGKGYLTRVENITQN